MFHKKKIMLILFMVVVFSVFVVASKVIKEETKVISDKVQEVEDCEYISWQEEVSAYGICVQEYAEVICDDEPLNESCSDVIRKINYTCANGTEIVEKTDKKCDKKAVLVNDIVKVDTSEYECSTTEEGNDVVVVCDSKYDGNGDGECSSGESCMKFVVDGDKYQKYEKNSRDDFVSSDDSFFLEKASVEVLK